MGKREIFFWFGVVSSAAAWIRRAARNGAVDVDKKKRGRKGRRTVQIASGMDR